MQQSCSVFWNALYFDPKLLTIMSTLLLFMILSTLRSQYLDFFKTVKWILYSCFGFIRSVLLLVHLYFFIY